MRSGRKADHHAAPLAKQTVDRELVDESVNPRAPRGPNSEWRRVIRNGVSTLVCSLFVLIQPVWESGIFVIGFLPAVWCTLISSSTVGRTFRSGWWIVCGSAVGLAMAFPCIGVLLSLDQSVKTQSLVTGAMILVTSFTAALMGFDILFRRFAIIFTVVALLIVQSLQLVPSLLTPFRLFLEFFLGVFVGVAVALFVLPERAEHTAYRTLAQIALPRLSLSYSALWNTLLLQPAASHCKSHGKAPVGKLNAGCCITNST